MLDEENRYFYYDGQKIKLTPIETELLEYLIDNKHALVPVRKLAQKFFGKATPRNENCVTSNVCYLNFKLHGILKITMRSKKIRI